MRDSASDLPAGWAECRVSDVAEVNPALDRCPFPQGGNVHFVPMPAVEPESGRIDISQTRPYDAVKKGYTAFVAGDVLFAKITPCMENGKMAVVPTLPASVAFGSTEFHVLRSRQGVSPHYLYHFVSGQAFRHEAEHNMTGAVGQKRVPTTFVADHTFPLPPTREQHRIVAKIEELFSELNQAVESLTLARAQLKTYRQALLKAAFEGKLTADWRAANPDKLEPPKTLLARIRAEREARYEEALADWQAAVSEWRSGGGVGQKPRRPRLPDLLTDSDVSIVRDGAPVSWGLATIGSLFEVCIGSTPSRKTPAYWGGETNWVSSGEVQFSLIGKTKERITESGFESISARMHPPGTVMLGMIGEGRTRGQSAILTQYATHNQNCAAIRVSDTPIPPKYVYRYFEFTYEETRRVGSGNNQKALNKERIQNVAIPISALAEMREISERLDTILSQVDATLVDTDADIHRIAALRQTILRQAFAGRLVSQDPTDEPAATLLARLGERAPVPRTRRRRSE